MMLSCEVGVGSIPATVAHHGRFDDINVSMRDELSCS